MMVVRRCRRLKREEQPEGHQLILCHRPSAVIVVPCRRRVMSLLSYFHLPAATTTEVAVAALGVAHQYSPEINEENLIVRGTIFPS